MSEPERYPYVPKDPALGEAGFRPILPLLLNSPQGSAETSGLLDTGATVNVMPYSLGTRLSYEWERQTTALDLTGNLAQYQARAVLVQAIVGNFQPVQLIFAWTQAENIPLILGQVNFFMEFNLCFYRHELAFEVQPRAR
jgi:hypothetical protein